jgi:hypothetical protein
MCAGACATLRLRFPISCTPERNPPGDGAIEYGRSLIAKYKVETLGELPPEEQLEFARLWANATGGVKSHDN